MISKNSVAAFRSLLACLGVLCCHCAQAAWQDIGDMKRVTHSGQQLTLTNDRAVVSITALAPDLIRVRIVPGTSMPPDHSYAVSKTDWSSVSVEVIEQPNFTVMRTPALEVRVQLAPFRLAFYDRQGVLLTKDADSRGTSWDGTSTRTWKSMPDNEHYYGLGEKSSLELDKHGHTYVEWNQDPTGFEATTDPLYQSVPFFIGLRAGRAYGIFLDNTYRTSFDMGATERDLYSFGAEAGELNYYVFGGPTPKAVVSRFTELVGRPPQPPRWALGYTQSRYSYYPESTVRFIAENFRHRRIPCDALFLDIHFMDGYRVFTWDKQRFPDPKRMLTELRQSGFHVIAAVDPYVKIDPSFEVYRQGVAKGHFLKNPDGSLLIGRGWPGDTAFPDYSAPAARDWWGSLFKEQLEQGISGILTDMNEPTQVDIRPSGTTVGTLNLDVLHTTGYGPRSHAEIHNVYGMLETLATRDGILQARPNERPFVITRATYAGGQRYAAQWSGDNKGTWDHMRLSIPMLTSMGLSGLSFVGADIGGISPVPSPELYTRWLAYGVLTPFVWTHSAGPGNIEPWSFGNRLEEINRNSIRLRYHLMPYIYTAFWEASQTGTPMMRPLLLDFPEDMQAVITNDEYLFGNDLLVAPVTQDDATSRGVYLPAGTWYDYFTDRRYQGPTYIQVSATLDRLPLFVRGGAIIPSQQDMQYTDEAPIDPLTLDVFPDGASSREYYEDDGISFDYQHGKFMRQRMSVSPTRKGLTLTLAAREGGYVPSPRSLVVRIHGTAARQVTSLGRALRPADTLEKLRETSQGWFYDRDSRVITLKIPDEGNLRTLEITG